MRIRRAKKMSAGLDMAPLIDVVFQLIIFILLSSSFLVQPGISVDLPQAETAEAKTQQPLVVRVPRGENAPCYVGDVRVEMADLPAYLRQLRAGRDSDAIVIACDQRADVARFVKVIDIAKGAGFRKVDIATRK